MKFTEYYARSAVQYIKFFFKKIGLYILKDYILQHPTAVSSLSVYMKKYNQKVAIYNARRTSPGGPFSVSPWDGPINGLSLGTLPPYLHAFN